MQLYIAAQCSVLVSNALLAINDMLPFLKVSFYHRPSHSHEALLVFQLNTRTQSHSRIGTAKNILILLAEAAAYMAVLGFFNSLCFGNSVGSQDLLFVGRVFGNRDSCAYQIANLHGNDSV